MKTRLEIIVAVALLATSGAWAQVTFHAGDVIVGGESFNMPPPGFYSTLLLYNRLGYLQRTLHVGAFDIYFDAVVLNDVLFVTSPQIRRYDALGSAVGPYLPGVNLLRLSFSRNGVLYASDSGGGVVGYRPDGSLAFRYNRLSGPSVAGVDLSSDQCTLIVTSETRVATLNVCLPGDVPHVFGSPLPHFAWAIRILPDRSLLVAHESGVSHLDAAGQLLRTYPSPFGSTEQIALAPDGTSFWVADFSSFEQVDIVSGQVLRGPFVAPFGIYVLAVAGEPRAAFNAAMAMSAEPADATSTTGLLVLVLAIVALALWRLRS